MDKTNLKEPFERKALVEELQKKLMRITFTKVDGSTRVMVCTLHQSLTEFQNPALKNAIPKNEEVIAVWDVENEAWRSFRINSVTKCENMGEMPGKPKHLQKGKRGGKVIEGKGHE